MSRQLAIERLSRNDPRVRLLIGGIGVVAAIALVCGVLWWCVNGWLAGDTLTYWLAGRRVLVGHELYAVGPDDPWIPPFDIRPFGLYSPPLIALPWLLLAAMPGTLGMVVWWVSMAFLAIWAAAALLLGTRGLAGVLWLPLMPAFTLLVGVGNVDAALLAGIVMFWMLVASGRDRAAGLLVGVLVSLKLTPAVLVTWLIATRRWAAVLWFLGATAILAAAVAVILGPSIFIDYAVVVVSATGAGRPWAVAVAAAGLVLLLPLARRNPSLGFALAIALMPLGSPVAAGHSWAMLGAAAAPLMKRLQLASARAGPRRRSAGATLPTR